MESSVQEKLGFRIANAQALGFGVLGVLGWMYSMTLTGWFPIEVSAGATGTEIVILTAYALLVAALASFLRGESWHGVFFMFWSAYAWASQAQLGEVSAGAYRGWFYLTLTAFLLILAWGALQDEALGLLRPLVALGSALVFLGVALGYLGVGAAFLIGGYVGLLTALLEFWIAATEIGAEKEPAR